MKNVLICMCSLMLVQVVRGQEEFGPPTSVECRHLNTTYMSTTSNLGVTFIPFRTPAPTALSTTFGLAAIDDLGKLVMHADNELWGSDNDGCSWLQITTKGAIGTFRVVAGPSDVAYAWQNNGTAMHFVTYDISITGNNKWTDSWGLAPVKMRGFVVDPLDPMHIRTAGDEGQVYESFNGGGSWTPIGVAAKPGGVLGYVTEFDKNDLDHAVYGRVLDGGYVTFDGGQTWTQSTGLASVQGGNVNLYSAVISPVDSAIVFAMAQDETEFLNREPSLGRHIYASTDGGLSYTPVLDNQSNGVTLSNAPVMHADPRNKDVLILLSSASPLFGGTTFYRYDLYTNTFTSVHNSSIPKIRVIESSRFNPGNLYVGFDYY